MSVFICWSEPRSRALAHAVGALLLKTLKLKKDDVFISDSIEKGANWFNSLQRELNRAKVGIVCLTGENLASPWLHFEAGALGNRLAIVAKTAPRKRRRLTGQTETRRLFTLLHGVAGAELVGPLSAYQATATTEKDIGEMVLTLARVLKPRVLRRPKDRARGKNVSMVRRAHWNEFKQTIDNLSVPARQVVDLETAFDRKTFNEPVDRCTDQTWIHRYDGVQETRARLLDQEKLVQAACSPNERHVFTMLLAELNGYAMAMHSLLLRPRKFKLVDPGELKIDSPTRTCCEDRRLAIRSLVTLLLYPVDAPLRHEAVRFMGAETNAERKMIVHRLEGTIRRYREVVLERSPRGSFEPTALNQALEALTSGRMPIEYRASSWDLDRIYYYLLIQYFTTGALSWSSNATRSGARAAQPRVMRDKAVEYQWLCAARDVEMEVERYRAKSKGGSLMPLVYALCALQELHPELTNRANVVGAVQSALALVEQELARATESDATRTIRQLVANVRPSRRRSVRQASDDDHQAITAARGRMTASAPERMQRAQRSPAARGIRRRPLRSH